jgi:phosphoglycerate dehydrogenase-like enzyme
LIVANSSDRLRVVVATPLAEEHCQLIERLEPRIEVVRDQSLYPPMRHPADFSGDPSFRRTPSQQQAFERLLDSAEALYGIPDVDPVALKRTVDANRALRWVHTMAAGGGGQVKAAGLAQEQLSRIVFTTSAGVHGGPLAEFAVFGVLAGAKNLGRLLAQQRDRNWTGRWEMRQVSEITVLVVGLGGIGQEVATKLSALGATIIGTSRHLKPVEHVDRLVPDRHRGYGG